MEKPNIDQATINTFHWLLSEVWDLSVLARLGYHDTLEDKIEKVIQFIKENGINEISMSLEDSINPEDLSRLISKFN